VQTNNRFCFSERRIESLKARLQSSRGAAKDFSHGRNAVERIERRMSRGAAADSFAAFTPVRG